MTPLGQATACGGETRKGYGVPAFGWRNEDRMQLFSESLPTPWPTRIFVRGSSLLALTPELLTYLLNSQNFRHAGGHGCAPKTVRFFTAPTSSACGWPDRFGPRWGSTQQPRVPTLGEGIQAWPEP